jgi:hypothetical protein
LSFDVPLPDMSFLSRWLAWSSLWRVLKMVGKWMIRGSSICC